MMAHSIKVFPGDDGFALYVCPIRFEIVVFDSVEELDPSDWLDVLHGYFRIGLGGKNYYSKCIEDICFMYDAMLECLPEGERITRLGNKDFNIAINVVGGVVSVAIDHPSDGRVYEGKFGVDDMLKNYGNLKSSLVDMVRPVNLYIAAKVQDTLPALPELS